MEKCRVGVIGATGMVGQRFLTLLQNHPYFELRALIASPRSAGKTYEEAEDELRKRSTEEVIYALTEGKPHVFVNQPDFAG